MQLKTGTPAMTVLLAAMTGLGPLSTDIYLASMPHIGAALGASPGAVQLTLSLYIVGFAVGQLVYGPLSDKFGRRPVLLAGFCVYMVATIACIFASSIGLLIMARVVQAFGAAGPIILTRAIVRDLFEGARAGRQLALQSTIMGVTPIGAPVLGGFLEAGFGWRASFVAMASIGLILTACAYFLLPETNKRRQDAPISPASILRSFGIVLQNRAYVSYLALQALSYNGLFAFLSGSSFVLQQIYGFNSVQFGLTFACCSSSFVTGTFIGSRIVHRRGLEGMIRIGVGFMLVSGIGQIIGVLLFPQHFAAIIIPQALYFLGLGFMLPQTLAAAMTPFPERAGAASSLMGFVQMTSAALVGSLMGASYGTTALPLVLVMGVAGIAAFVVFHATAGARRTGSRRF